MDTETIVSKLYPKLQENTWELDRIFALIDRLHAFTLLVGRKVAEMERKVPNVLQLCGVRISS